MTDLDGVRWPRMTYDRGTLELMTTSRGHERDNRLLSQIVLSIAEEWGIDILDVGSMTFLRADLDRGDEPDTTFHIRDAAALRAQDDRDQEVDPPPDLLIEMEVTTSAIPTLPLFAAMGIPEVWRVIPDRVAIFSLQENDYVPVPASVAFPSLTDEIVTRFLVDGRTMTRPQWLRAIRAWAGNHPHSDPGGERGESGAQADPPST
ncbi:MAG: Uma2 family endonuclease [Chloroflexota bacterium]|nr:Uma2 family endonuclease [Chloroflexota bacterium]